MLAYSSIAHAGYLLVALVAANEAGQNAVLYYLVVYTLMNLGAFGVISYFGYTNRQENLTFDAYSGLGYRFPFAALAMAVFMFGLAGIPPTGGFMAKFYVFGSAVKAGYIPLVIIGVLNSVISVYYYLKVVIYLYMREPDRGTMVGKSHPAMVLALLISIIGVLFTGIMPGTLYEILRQAVLITP
jgi:NADH-quinone oxidoreductase subunit N